MLHEKNVEWFLHKLAINSGYWTFCKLCSSFHIKRSLTPLVFLEDTLLFKQNMAESVEMQEHFVSPIQQAGKY